MTKITVTVQYRRKREGKTNYYKRLSLLKSNKARLVLRRSLKHILLQIVEYQPAGDKVLVSYNTRSLEKAGWKYGKNNLPAAYLTGLMVGKLAQSKDIKEAILDLGLHPSINGSRIYAAVKGAIDAGLKVPCRKEVFPSDDRISGKHIVEFADKLKSTGSHQFSKLKKADIGKMTGDFILMKEKILKSKDLNIGN
ncbi:MAG: 50S ribosomal protein L18 [Candidatus Woesearchaeota archaeon]